MPSRSSTSALKGLIAGTLATGLMTLYQEKAAPIMTPSRGRPRDLKHEKGESRPPTVRLADRLSKRFSGKRVRRENKALAGEFFHFALGAPAGAIYERIALRWPPVRAGYGAAYGVAVLLVAGEIAVPLARLSPPPWRIPWQNHLYAISTHVVYGLSLEMFSRLLDGKPLPQYRAA